MNNYIPIQAHIHPPEPYGDNWSIQLLGDIVRPLYDEFENNIDWLWVTRYLSHYPDDFTLGYEIPASHVWNFVIQDQVIPCFRYITFRASVSEDIVNHFQDRCNQLAANTESFIIRGGWSKYPLVDDLGNPRFTHSSRAPKEREHRAYLIAKFMHYTVLLSLSALVQDENGLWYFEPTEDSANNPQGVFFQSVRHLFSNSINLPFKFAVSLKHDQLRFMAPYNGLFEFPQPLSQLIQHEAEWLTLELKL